MSTIQAKNTGSLDEKKVYNPNRVGQSTAGKAADIIIIALLTILAMVTVLPFYNMLIMSLADYETLMTSKVYLLPKTIDFTNYKVIFSEDTLVNSFGVTTFITAAGTLLSMIITTFGAYVLSKKDLPGRNFLFIIVIIPMYFTAGLIPFYLVVNNLGFTDRIWAMIVPNALNIFNMILMKNFFSSIHPSLEESARIDGANDIVILFRIVLPVSIPIIATISLFYAVARWNEWWFGMIFIRDTAKIPLQLLLRQVVVEATLDLGTDMANSMRDQNMLINSTAIQMATATVATIPILCVYPFIQKYFTQGIMLGAIKS